MSATSEPRGTVVPLRPRPHEVNHRSRLEYAALAEALDDAALVLDDLVEAAHGQLLVPSADVDFTVRRALQLVRACARQARETGDA